MDMEDYRRFYLLIAEWIDSWRLVPRVMVLAYMWLIYEVSLWYMGLDVHMLAGCMPIKPSDCVVDAPTTQHAALITTLIGFSAGIFGLYANSGKKTEVPNKKAKPTLTELLGDHKPEVVERIEEQPVVQDPDEIPPESFDDNY